MLHIVFRATNAASLCFESVFEGGNREEGGLKRAAPTRSARSLRPSAKIHRSTPTSPTLFVDLRGRRRPDERQQHKWDEHGACLLRASRERSRHGVDSRLRARWPLCPQSGCARFMALEPRIETLARRSQHSGQPCTILLQRLGYWANRLGTLAQTAKTRRIARGEGRRRSGRTAAFLRLRVVDVCVSVTDLSASPSSQE